MSNRTANSGDDCVQRGFAGAGVRSGVAKDKLIFIIICSVALAVAAVTLVRFFTGGSVKHFDITWQCLDCNYEFNKKKDELPPIPCEKCGGQAVRAIYRDCPACGKKVLSFRMRLTEQAQAQREAMRKQAEAAGKPISSPLEFMMLPMDMQYWVKQPDGNFGWTAWMPARSPEAIQTQRDLRCSNCDALLFPSPSRSVSSRN